jgi:endonuclease YncB( thermonuclease family)
MGAGKPMLPFHGPGGLLLRFALMVVLVVGVVVGMRACSSDEPVTIPADPVACVVSRVGDGDSLNCQDGRTIRLLLIDAPEIAQAPYGAQARETLIELAPEGAALSVEYDAERVDDFGRDLAYLYDAAGAMVNEEMVARGYAVLFVILPNGRYRDRISAAMEKARASGLGLWGEWGFACLPVDFRAGRCS